MYKPILACITTIMTFSMTEAAAQAVDARRVIVATQVLNAMHEAAGVYVQCVDMDCRAPLPAPVRLPGASSLGPLIPLPDRPYVLALSGAAQPSSGAISPEDTVHISSFSMTPFLFQPESHLLPDTEWWQGEGVFIRGPEDRQYFVWLGFRTDSYDRWRGRIQVRGMENAPNLHFTSPAITWPMPGAPVHAAALPRPGAIAVLCREPETSSLLVHALDAASGAVLLPAWTPEAGMGMLEPGDIATSADGRYLYILACAMPDETWASWLYVLDACNFAPIGEPVRMEGRTQSEGRALVPAADGSCWVATAAPGAGGAYASRVEVSDETVQKTAEYPLLDVAHPIWIAVEPGGSGVAVAVDQRLEAWPGGVPSTVQYEYAAPIRTLTWTHEGLFVGEAGRIHLADGLTAAPLVTVQLQTGHVSAILPVPPEAIAPSGMDAPMTSTENAAPKPLGASIPLNLPPVLTFRGEAAGRERREIPLDWPADAPPLAWNARYDEASMPWLRIEPRTGALPGKFQVEIDPLRYNARYETLQGILSIDTIPLDTSEYGAIHTAPILVRLLPPRGQIQQVLWAIGAPEPGRKKLDALAGFLAGPPLYFSQSTQAMPGALDLAAASVLVLDAAAASRGALTRAALLDYVAGGGALLFLGGPLESATSRSIGGWLSAMGIQLDTSVSVSGQFTTDKIQGLAGGWKDFLIDGGCGIRLADGVDADAFVPKGGENPRDAIFVALAYGRGRVAILASPSPLCEEALKDEPHLRFAGSLFRWLAEARDSVYDLDDDGLTDTREDRNGNGVFDPGETDLRCFDSDGDGIADGMEDRNRNGQVDEGETDPLNADSDGDGVQDGADDTPVCVR